MTTEQAGALRIATERDAGTTRLLLAGELDHHTVGTLWVGVRAALADPGGERVLVDLSRVTFLDSTGLGALVQAYRLAEAGRVDFGVTDPRPDVRATFDVTGLTPLLLHPGA